MSLVALVHCCCCCCCCCCCYVGLLFLCVVFVLFFFADCVCLLVRIVQIACVCLSASRLRSDQTGGVVCTANSVHRVPRDISSHVARKRPAVRMPTVRDTRSPSALSALLSQVLAPNSLQFNAHEFQR